MKLGGKPRVTVLVSLLVLLLGAILLPQVVSAGWHIAHGRTVNYRSWKVVVPFGWYAISRGPGMSVERMAELPWQKAPVATFLPVYFTKTYPFSYDLFGKEQQRTLRAMGYLLLEQRDVRVAGQDGRCWTFDKYKNHNQLWIACIVPKDLTSADYIGNRAYADEFLSFFTQTQRNPTAAN
jgi:hypothetical protein